MRARTIEDPLEFLALTATLRSRHPLTTNVMGSVALAVAQGRYPISHAWVVEDESEVVGAALRTPPHKLLLTPMPNSALAPLFDLINETDSQWPGFLAPAGLAQEVRAHIPGEWKKTMHELVYKLHELKMRATPGLAVRSSAEDVALLGQWLHAFADEAGVLMTLTEDQIHEKAVGGEYFFWRDKDRHVAMASHAAPVEMDGGRIARVGPVYTPPDQRRRGYGAAITAHISQLLLDQGCTVMLHTDAANPSSNSIYRQIGFVQVDELEDWEREG